MLWFAFILVSLNHWKQHLQWVTYPIHVVICFHFSIFEPLETTKHIEYGRESTLWFAFILVSLNHWKQQYPNQYNLQHVVICFHFSIFEPLETTLPLLIPCNFALWFAFILVSLNHWKQQLMSAFLLLNRCDLLSF